MKRNIFFLPLLCLFLILCLTGCGKKDAALESYRTNMEQFFENVKILDSSINAIDPDSESATADLLYLLDAMDTSFAQMALLEVPDSFPGVEELADQASENMSQAVSYYHQAYDGEFDASAENVAYQYYERANLRFQYIASILHGDIPEEIYVDEDASEETPAE